jgi:hypothetical protein
MSEGRGLICCLCSTTCSDYAMCTDGPVLHLPPLYALLLLQVRAGVRISCLNLLHNPLDTSAATAAAAALDGIQVRWGWFRGVMGSGGWVGGWVGGNVGS